MSFQWVQMRIGEEADRRRREAEILARLPVVLAELHGSLAACLHDFTEAFGPESAAIELRDLAIHVEARELLNGEWRKTGEVEVLAAPAIPGFDVRRGASHTVIEVGVLPGEKLFFRDRESDQYVSMEELTRRILDRVLFPRLGE
jgi:hypothetical protein